MINNNLTLIEVSNLTGLEVDLITDWIFKEWLSPTEIESFDQEDVSRLHLINELQSDFGVNEEAIPLILHLIDRLCYVQDQFRQMKEKNL